MYEQEEEEEEFQEEKEEEKTDLGHGKRKTEQQEQPDHQPVTQPVAVATRDGGQQHVHGQCGHRHAGHVGPQDGHQTQRLAG